MIYDTLNNLPNYLGMSDNLDAVIEFVMARDINNLPAGKPRTPFPDRILYTSWVMFHKVQRGHAAGPGHFCCIIRLAPLAEGHVCCHGPLQNIGRLRYIADTADIGGPFFWRKFLAVHA